MEQSFWPSPSGIPILKVRESGNNYSNCTWTETENALSFPEGKRRTVSRRWVKAECQNKNKSKTDVYHSPLSLPHVYLPVQSHATDWRLELQEIPIPWRPWDRKESQDRNSKWEESVRGLIFMWIDHPIIWPLTVILEPFTSIPVQLQPYSRIHHQEYCFVLKNYSRTFLPLFFQFMPWVCQFLKLFRKYKPLVVHLTTFCLHFLLLQGKLHGPSLNPTPK